MKQGRHTVRWWIRRALVLFAAVVVTFIVLYFLPDSRIVVSRETTYLTEPLDGQGYVDYLAAINQRAAEGVTPDNNAAVLYWQALGPGPIDEGHREEFFRRLGMDPLPDEGDYFQSVPDFHYLDEHRDAWRFTPWVRDDDPHLAEWLDDNRQPIDLFITGTLRTKHFVPNLLYSPNETNNGTVSPVMSSSLYGLDYREISRSLMQRSMLHSGSGRHKEAWNDCLACIRLAGNTTNGLGIVGALVNYNQIEIAVAGVPAILHEGNFTADELTKMRQEFREVATCASAAQAVDRGGRIMGLDAIQSISRERRGLRGSIDWNQVMREFNLFRDRMVTEMKCETYDLDGMSMDELNESLENETTALLAAYPFSRRARTRRMVILMEAILAPAISAIMTAEHRCQGRLERIEVVFALSLYRAQHGEFPEDLAALVPMFLDEIPLDPIDDQPVRYRQQADGYSLWSIGFNGVDDGGRTVQDWEDDEEAEYSDHWDDDVFRVPQQLPPMPVAHTVKPPEFTPALKALLDDNDQHYDADEQMLVTNFRSPGYHTRIASGTPVHPTRESLIYGLALLQRNAEGDTDRAAAVIRRIVGLQDTDPGSETYGVWPWLLEEPLAEMESPDMNWADFCGSQIAHMLVEQSDKLPDDLQKLMRESLRHAVRSIRKRDVQPGYTNIAVLGGSVCVVSSELLGDAELLEYGRQRLQGVVQHVEQHGGFSEYNSPPYSKVVIGECERLLHLAHDPASREAAESLRHTCWKDISASFHPTTQQWAGPHSRTSRVYLEASTVEFLSLRTGVAIEMHPTMANRVRPGRYATVPPLPCPEELASRFRESVEQPLEIRRVFARNESGAATIVGTTWLTDDACLGSVTRSSFWTQRKPLIGYWKTADDPAVVFSARFLHEGENFASMGIRTAQKGPRVLCLFEGIPNRGDWHRSLDRPADGIFQATDFRVRFELRGAGATAESLGDGRYELAAGGYRIVIHTLPGHFDGNDIDWKLGEDGRSLEGICYRGELKSFDFSNRVDVELCAGIELLRHDEAIVDRPPQITNHSAGRVDAKWECSSGNVLEVNTFGE